MKPTEPGRYIAREFSFDLLGNKLFTPPYEVEVVAGVPNARHHKLLVRTGSKNPAYKSLDLFDWSGPFTVTHDLSAQVF
jgi:hypothetical protein